MDLIKTGNFSADSVVSDCVLQPEINRVEGPHQSIIPVTAVSKQLKKFTEFRLAAEVPVVVTKALELMISELSLRAWLSARMEDPNRCRLRPEDLTAGICSTARLDFLRDVLPADELQTILAMRHSTS